MTPPTGLCVVLYEDNHLLVLNKPSGLATMGVEASRPSLLTLAKDYVKQTRGKPGNVYLGVVSRLDTVASGVVVFARTSKAARRLTEQFRSRSVEKRYWAIVEGSIEPPEGECVDWLRKDERLRRVVVAPPSESGAREARLAYRSIGRIGRDALLEIELETGRKHQIRAQLAARGAPLLGDAVYGCRRRFTAGIALHSRRLCLDHPTTKARLSFLADPPAHWPPLPKAS